MGEYILLAVVAAGVAYGVTPGVLMVSRKIGAVDIPDDRKVHAVPTPTLGGIAIFLGFLAAFSVASVLPRFEASFRPLTAWPPNETVGVVMGATIIFILGVVDDLKGLKAPVKLSGQLMAAGFVFQSGIRLDFLRLPFGETAIAAGADVSAIFTIFWIVLIVNAVNLIDGLDGLAAGITCIAAGTFFLYSYRLTQGLSLAEQVEQTAPLISIVIVGATIGFLRYNFNPAKIFMGDSGAMTLGFLLAVATVVGVGRSAQNPIPESLLFYLPLAIPLIVLAIPIADTVLAVVRRARRGGHVFHADKEHLHHRLLELGHGHRKAVLIMYAWTGVIAGVTLTLSFVGNPVYRWVSVVAGLGVLVYTVLPQVVRSRP